MQRASKHCMAKSFREMLAWQLAFELERKVVMLVNDSSSAKRDFRFRDQLVSAAMSVPANIAEGFGRYRPTEMARFLEIACGSLDETENHLRAGVDSGYLCAEPAAELVLLAARCRRVMRRWQSYLRSAQSDPHFRSGPAKKRAR